MLGGRKPTFRNSIQLGQPESRGRNVLAGSTVPSDSGAESGRKESILENTYKMQPDQKFVPGIARRCIREILERNLKEKVYDPDKAKELCVKLSEEIKAKVKEMSLADRFKLVCLVHIGKPLGQGVQIVSRCLWNPASDAYATEALINDQIFCEATVYSVYVE